MEADVALCAGAGETWSAPPSDQPRSEKSKVKSRGRGGIPIASPSSKHRSKRRQQQQAQIRSPEDDAGGVSARPQGQQRLQQNSTQSRLQDVQQQRKGSASSQEHLDKALSSSGRGVADCQPPQEQKKSSSRNRRRRAAAKRLVEQKAGDMQGDSFGGESLAQSPSPVPPPDSTKRQISDDQGFYSYEPDNSVEIFTEDLSLESQASKLSGNYSTGMTNEPGTGSKIIPRLELGHHSKSYSDRGRSSKRRGEGSTMMGRVVPKSLGHPDSGGQLADLSYGTDAMLTTVTSESDFESNITSFQNRNLSNQSQSLDLQGSETDSFCWIGAPTTTSKQTPAISTKNCTLPTALPFNSPSAQLSQSQGHSIILEVKDRPDLYFAPSNSSLSDSAPNFSLDELGQVQILGLPLAPSQHHQLPSHPHYSPMHPLSYAASPGPPMDYVLDQPVSGPVQYSTPLLASFHPPQIVSSQHCRQPYIAAANVTGSTFPLDLSFSPRASPPAHSSLCPVTTQQPVSVLAMTPLPAHCHSASPSPQGSANSLLSKRPSLTPSGDESPLDLSVKNKKTQELNVKTNIDSCSFSGDRTVPLNKTTETPLPLDLRIGLSSQADTSWQRDDLSLVITDQPFSVKSAKATRNAINSSCVEGVTTASHVYSDQWNAGKEQESMRKEQSMNIATSDTHIINQSREILKHGSTKENTQSVSKNSNDPQSSLDNLLPSTETKALAPSLTTNDTPSNMKRPTVKTSSSVASEAATSSTTPPSSSTSASNTKPSTQPNECDSIGFLNTYELLQQKAGIQHDDIVVGPCRSYMTFPPQRHPGDDNCIADLDTVKTFEDRDMVNHNYPQDTSKSVAPEAMNLKSGSTACAQTLPRRIPRRIEPDSPQIARKKAGAVSRLPKLSTNSQDNSMASGTKAEDDKLNDNAPDHKRTIELTWKYSVPKQDEVSKSVDSERNVISATNYDSSSEETSPLLPANNISTSKSSKSLGSNTQHDNTISFPSASGIEPSQKQPPVKDNCVKTKTTNNSHTSKQKDVSKLHMLSNIPVPVCHDPKPRTKLQSQNSLEVKLDDDSDETPLLSQAEKKETHHDTFDSPSSQSEQGQTVSAAYIETNTSLQLQPMSEQALRGENSISISVEKENSNLYQEEEIENRSNTQNMTRQPKQNNIPTCGPTMIKADIGHVHMNGSFEKDDLRNVEVESLQRSKNLKEGASEKKDEQPLLHHSEEELSMKDKSDSRLEVASVSASVPSSPKVDANTLGAGTESTSSACALIPGHSGSELEASPPIRKKKSRLPRFGILRRGSDRTAEAAVRRGNGVGGYSTISTKQSGKFDDPNVEELKRATSIAELCQSVASLLNIDNEQAAAMITGELSTREDLVEGLDADAITDYLSQYGVLDISALPQTVACTPNGEMERRRAILRQVESRGPSAVALFVNALRQSGQLHLASSLDNQPRIRPSPSGGYFGSGPHKGEITLRVELEWLKIFAPPEPVMDKDVDANLLAPTDTADLRIEDDDVVKPRRCWCFCLRRKKKPASRDKGSSGDRGSRDQSHRKEKGGKRKKSKSFKGDDQNKYQVKTQDGDGKGPVVMEFDPRLELVKLKHQSGPSQSETNEGPFTEHWRRTGPHFSRQAGRLCQQLVQTCRDDLVRHFEQVRATLVLEINTDMRAVLITCICMSRAQVSRLQTDVAAAVDDGGLLDTLQEILFSSVDIRDLEIFGVKLKVALDQQQVDAALNQLS